MKRMFCIFAWISSILLSGCTTIQGNPPVPLQIRINIVDEEGEPIDNLEIVGHDSCDSTYSEVKITDEYGTAEFLIYSGWTECDLRISVYDPKKRKNGSIIISSIGLPTTSSSYSFNLVKGHYMEFSKEGVLVTDRILGVP